MAISAADISALTAFSWAEIKTAAKAAMVNSLLGGGSISINGRSIVRVTLKEAQQVYEWADGNESLELNGGFALVRYGERI